MENGLHATDTHRHTQTHTDTHTHTHTNTHTHSLLTSYVLCLQVLFAMTDAENKDTNAADLKRKFSFFSTNDAAEVQLGGYDPATVSGTMW